MISEVFFGFKNAFPHANIEPNVNRLAIFSSSGLICQKITRADSQDAGNTIEKEVHLNPTSKA